MPKSIIVDTGAITGVLIKRDQWHKRAKELFEVLPKPMVTCEAVIAELYFRLRKVNAERTVLDIVRSGAVKIDFSLSAEVEAVETLIGKYEDVPMSLADACLVRMSEIFDAPVFTFDSDFKIYRRNRNRIIPLLGIDD